MVRKVLSREITSYDLLKTFALLTMVIDHVGFYFFPEQAWLRVIGRTSAPVWFFLIGYANSRDTGGRMWGGLIILVAMNLVVGFPVFSLNILATMLFIRFVIDETMRRAVRHYEPLIGISLIFVFLIIPTMMLWEYGTMGVLFAMYGYMRRHPEALVRLPKGSPEVFIALIAIFYVGFQSLLFGFHEVQVMAFALGMLPVLIWLSRFRPMEYPGLARALTAPVAGLLKLCGRHSLEFYVLHLALFKIAATLMGDERFAWFNLQLFASG